MAKYCCVCGEKIGMMQGTPMFGGEICLSCSAKMGNLTPGSDPQERQRAIEYFKSALSGDALAPKVRDGVSNALRSCGLDQENAVTDILPCSGGFALFSDGENIVIRNQKTEELIPISQIQSFLLKEPGHIYGTIEFTTARANTASVYVGFGISTALGAAKTFTYYKEYYEAAKQIRNVVMNYKKPGSQSDPAASGMIVSVVDEIRGLKSLLDDGILTQEEFEAKKKQLLGI